MAAVYAPVVRWVDANRTARMCNLITKNRNSREQTTAYEYDVQHRIEPARSYIRISYCYCIVYHACFNHRVSHAHCCRATTFNPINPRGVYAIGHRKTSRRPLKNDDLALLGACMFRSHTALMTLCTQRACAVRVGKLRVLRMRIICRLPRSPPSAATLTTTMLQRLQQNFRRTREAIYESEDLSGVLNFVRIYLFYTKKKKQVTGG